MEPLGATSSLRGDAPTGAPPELARRQQIPASVPPPTGSAFFYLVEYLDGAWVSFGTVSADPPALIEPGQEGCP